MRGYLVSTHRSWYFHSRAISVVGSSGTEAPTFPARQSTLSNNSRWSSEAGITAWCWGQAGLHYNIYLHIEIMSWYVRNISYNDKTLQNWRRLGLMDRIYRSTNRGGGEIWNYDFYVSKCQYSCSIKVNLSRILYFVTSVSPAGTTHCVFWPDTNLLYPS